MIPFLIAMVGAGLIFGVVVRPDPWPMFVAGLGFVWLGLVRR